jgi:hypothetical protein
MVNHTILHTGSVSLHCFHRTFDATPLKLARSDGLDFELIRKPIDSTQIVELIKGALGDDLVQY